MQRSILYPAVKDHTTHQFKSSYLLVCSCNGLTLAGCQVSTKAAPLSLPSSAGQGTKKIMKDLWVEIRTGKLLPWAKQTQLRKTDLLPIKSEWGNEK